VETQKALLSSDTAARELSETLAAANADGRAGCARASDTARLRRT